VERISIAHHPAIPPHARIPLTVEGRTLIRSRNPYVEFDFEFSWRDTTKVLDVVCHIGAKLTCRRFEIAHLRQCLNQSKFGEGNGAFSFCRERQELVYQKLIQEPDLLAVNVEDADPRSPRSRKREGQLIAEGVQSYLDDKARGVVWDLMGLVPLIARVNNGERFSIASLNREIDTYMGNEENFRELYWNLPTLTEPHEC